MKWKSHRQKARVDSVTDGLTGVYNRKALDSHIDALVERNTWTPKDFAILMVDIDDFKSINDAHGHPTGDRVLLALAQKCQDLIRNEDLIARYGGEEFIIVLTKASLANAIKKAKRICRAVANTHYAINDTKAAHLLSITVSIGVSAFRKGDTTESVIGRADQALYFAKGAGKNRVASENELIFDSDAKRVSEGFCGQIFPHLGVDLLNGQNANSYNFEYFQWNIKNTV
jgi:diguanylate cyclase (GGDEF)-like protein